jgi:ribonuclease P protein component
VATTDFERLMRSPIRQRSAHFAVHHVEQGPEAARARQAATPPSQLLSTGSVSQGAQAVDESASGLWLGCVVPKRHARRAVTRNLVKRQVRAVFQDLASAMPGGSWLVRLRQPFAVAQFPSAASPALRLAVRQELQELLARCARGTLPARSGGHGGTGSRAAPESAALPGPGRQASPRP